MLNMRKFLLQRRRILKLASRVACLLVLLAAAVWLNATSKADGPRFTCVLKVGNGEVTILSCGSSAGNFIYTCTQGTSGPCDIAPPANDDIANLNCVQYAAEGCPETFYAD